MTHHPQAYKPVEWRHSTQSMPIVPNPLPKPPVLAPLDVQALVAALRDVLTLSDDHTQHTHDRLALARMRAAEGLRAVGLEPAPRRSRIT